MIQVRLEWYEYAIAGHVGAMRHIEAQRKGCLRADGTRSDFDTDAEGAAAEMVVAKHLGIYWSGSVNTFEAADITPRIEVRHTKRHDGRLIIRPRDHDERFYVLVTGQEMSYTIWGGILCADAKRDEWLQNPQSEAAGGERARAAWFIPRTALKPLVIHKETHAEAA